MTSRFLKAAVGIATVAYLDAKHGLGHDIGLARASGAGERE